MLSSTGSLLICPQKMEPKLGVRNFIWISMDGRDPSIWDIFCYLLGCAKSGRYISRGGINSKTLWYGIRVSQTVAQLSVSQPSS